MRQGRKEVNMGCMTERVTTVGSWDSGKPMWVLPKRGEVGTYFLKAASGAGTP